MLQAPSATQIAANLARVQDNLAAAAVRAGRSPAGIRLIAVSKTQPPAAVAAAAAAGQRDFGENTVQDAMTKIPLFAGRDLDWHFIGHLQSNKAKLIPGSFSWLHSVDSLKLAERVSRYAVERNCTVNALIEVNITGGHTRHGVAPAAVAALLETLLAQPLPGLQLRGLMAIGPHPADAEESRRAFAVVRELRDRCSAHFGLPGFDQLSMGMSGDYAAAILEGATLVRIGTAIFGNRDDAP